MNEFEAKKAARIDRMRARAEAKDAEAQAARATMDRISDAIPMGQPVLVGHHSERKHRRDLARLDSAMRTTVEASREAEALRKRADRAEAGENVSSDDPDAIEKLRAKLAEANDLIERTKYANDMIRRGESEAEVETFMGWPSGRLETWHSLGHKTIPTTNATANVRRIRERIAALTAQANAAPKPDETINGVTIGEAENRVRIFFAGKPADAVRTALKSHGFRWSPTVGAWQRHASTDAWYWARQIAGRA